jgi:carbamoyltransferase
MKSILGISAFYHDSAAALVVDGKIIAAAQEERFTRVKHDFRFPSNAVAFCLAEAGLTPANLDAVVFYDKPILKFARILETYLAFAPQGVRSFFLAMPLWLKQKLFLPKEIDRGLNFEYEGPIYFTTHHESHAASAFFPSPYDEAAILTLDGVGEWSTSTWGVGRENHVTLQKEITFPHSIGLLYSAFTYYTGFKVNSGEYKVMGLAPYGKPKYTQLIYDHLIDLKQDGSFWLDQSYFNYCQGLTMTNRKFHKLFGAPPREPEAGVTQREMDLAASIQLVTEEVMLRCGQHIHNQTGLKNLCLAGGVALNCVANGKLLREGPFESIWIQPAAGDAGGALGAALFGWYQIGENSRRASPSDGMHGSFLGPKFNDQEVCENLKTYAPRSHFYPEESELCQKVSDLLANGKVVGMFQGRAEFGPRALGGRSILGDPRNTKMQSILNVKIKFRESFRPFAPAVLRESVGDYFELDADSPYMLLVAPVKRERRLTSSEENEGKFGIDLLNVVRSDIPSVTHVDFSARVQTVDENRNPRFYRLLQSFQQKTGYGVLVNTSFNIRGEPIVGTPSDAYRCFMFTDMDALVIENRIFLKEEQPHMPGAEEYKSQFHLD